ncbi:heavy metal translocating P-type ATPase [Sediminibacterium sp. TEGAF015]|uniref:heavy metal translocating P-type ATPase n=1 Tax=Sediminibacterium sp. TEGAF015 TaxID=575378 RepID=UPI002201468F|nr:cation-translocating P-type ATPase [Sediminibacterium sp. TEGAF015]BDQ12260.1 copper-exporting P-type ATPase A [Sediminibacterium sp. TEGAF015]
MEKVNWKVTGMSCTNCALSIDKFLKEKGMEEVKVNFIGGDVSFTMPGNTDQLSLQKGIQEMGYQVKGSELESSTRKPLFRSHLQRFAFCAIFTLPLMVHMIPGIHIHWLMNPYVQLGLTLPVFILGMDFFGRSGLKSLLKGVPNMNVLIAMGALSAFVYSLYGTLTNQATDYLFYETAATIITLVFLGYWMEDKSVEQTQNALRKLAQSQKTMANMIAYDNEQNEHIFPVESTSLKTGDLLLIRNGEAVPMDCKILSGEVSVDESIITGESIPVEKKQKDILIGGSTVVNGSVKAYVTAVGEDSVLGNILSMVKNAQTEKPPVQLLADKISAIFVPAVISIAVLTFILNYTVGSQDFTSSLMRSIAVLVISCPCAMGLATPAAIAVGLGRAAKNGVLFKNTKTLELFKDIQQVVFDKTGTLTTGKFSIEKMELTEAGSLLGEDTCKNITYSLEKYSTHPLAKAIALHWKTKEEIRFSNVSEEKGLGVTATDKEGNIYMAASFKAVSHLTENDSFNIYLVKNNQLLASILLQDEIRPEAEMIIKSLQQKGIKPILLSGDIEEKCKTVANKLGIGEVYAAQSPAQKLERIEALTAIAPTAMVGDGINDAPALAKATVGVSLSDATHIAMQSAEVVLMNHGIKNLSLALGLGKHTYKTIQQNLFWAFIYNIVAIPVAAMGFLSPTIGALIMGLSDVVLAINSVRLNFKKVD